MQIAIATNSRAVEALDIPPIAARYHRGIPQKLHSQHQQSTLFPPTAKNQAGVVIKDPPLPPHPLSNNPYSLL